MFQYILRRILLAPLILIGLSILIFGLLQLVGPAERVALYITGPPKGPDAVEALIRLHGLDQPAHVQYLRWMSELARFELGYSRTARMPVARALATYFPATLELCLWSFVPVMVFGTWLGLRAAAQRDRGFDQVVRLLSILGYSVPGFVVGLVLLMIFYSGLGWLQPGRLSVWAAEAVLSPDYQRYTGMYTLDALINGRLDIWWDAVQHVLMPAGALALLTLALVLRISRAAAIEVLHQDYIRAARARGIGERRILFGHAGPNAMIPVVTVGGQLLVGLLGGAVIIETVFNYPGIGRWAVAAARNYDAVSVAAVALFNGLLLVLVNLVVDLLYAGLDPRIRLS